MRRLLMAVAVIVAVVMVAGMASATLLGIAQYTGNRPDVKYDNKGRLVYDASSDLLEFQNSVDELIRLPGGTEVTITDEDDYDPVVGFGLAIYVDENGNFTHGVTGHTYSWKDLDNALPEYTSDYDMVEVLLRGTITVAGHTYNTDPNNTGTDTPILLLGADVQAFGWESRGVGDNAVDFLFGPVDGEWVDDGIWPTSPPTGAYALIGGDVDNMYGVHVIDFSQNFYLENKGGDKLPTPEPTTLLLLGSGLIGLAGLGRRKFKKGS